MITYYRDNSYCVKLSGVKSCLTDTYVNNATVTAQLKDEAGNNLGSAVSIPYVAASNGDYAGVIPEDVADLSSHKYGRVHVVADVSNQFHAEWTEPVEFENRRAC